MLFGDVRGDVSGETITLTLTTVHCAAGQYGCYFNNGTDNSPQITEGSVIAKITKSGSSYKIKPIGRMQSYLTDLGGIMTIVKTK